ncbi:MAG TPA: response regulator [Candidatus Pacearchaeota archaeon]|nr:response regulator [Candidatus Parcubacteria bacterium]HNP79549.1 response regulator [Candidatus Pacearchaeota archaeon]HOC53675.1 response regulator [Candidatus Pacearchaeota archaeon]HQM24527.1 response regulator [Candidatus Pacearchaeota archaeon]
MKKVLIIEDDKFLRELLGKKISSLGYSAVLAIDGEDGLEKMKTEKPDIILLDLILPGMNGFEVLEQAKKNPTINETPIIILSNLGQSEDIEKGLRLGAKDFLVKAHFTPQEIVNKIQMFLN